MLSSGPVSVQCFADDLGEETKSMLLRGIKNKTAEV